MRAPALPLLVALAAAPACRGSAVSSTPAPAADNGDPRPPIAEVRPHEVTSPSGTRVDPYFWLRDDSRSDPEVLAHLQAENAYTEAMLAPTAAAQEELYQEIIARIQQDDSSVPVLDRGHWYYTRFETGKEYPIHARRAGTMEAPEQILLDGNALAEGREFHRIGSYRVSPNGKLLAYTEDIVGRNQFRLRVIEIDGGEVLADVADNVTPAIEWANDDRTIFYVAREPTTLRSYRVHRHTLGTPPGNDPLVHEEPDTAFYTSIQKTKSDAYLVVTLWSTVSTEARLIDANRPDAPPRVFFPRERDHEYDIDHLEGRFLVRTNWQAENFRLMEVAQGKHADRDAWRDLVAHRDDASVESFALYRGFVAVGERSGGLRKVRVLPARGEPFLVGADEPAYVMQLVNTPDPDARAVRYVYSSPATPNTTFELQVGTRKRELLKREPVLGDFDPERYTVAYLRARARDGVEIPVSLVYRRDLARRAAPLLQVGYGSYGFSSDPWFQSTRLSLLDRGFVFAIAHVRGGQELGRRWYESGKLLHKKNTFRDFIDVTEFLIAEGYAAPDKVFALGGSAGGLLLGAVANMRPDLYRGMIAHVPFVDVVTTMLDESIPLTSNEYDEWGDPRKEEFYRYMLSYSPYDNVRAQDYPSILVTTGLHDSQVQYFEPAKWVARLRATRTDENLLLLHVNLEAGHGGRSGRYQRYRELARDYAFLLHVLERPDRRPGHGTGERTSGR